jgi:hypothetical protein
MVGMYLSARTMSHGGSRENAGRPSKYTDDQGNPMKSRRDQVPDILTREDLEKLAREKLKKKDKAG